MMLISVLLGAALIFLAGFLIGMACQYRCETEPNGHSERKV